MRISTDYKYIFFANPKTGSESVRKMLDPYSDIKDNRSDESSEFTSHMSPKRVKALFEKKGWNYNDFFKFVFIRNPWDKMVSLYEMKYSGKRTKVLVAGTLENQIKDRLKKFKQRYFTKKPSFKEWVLSVEGLSDYEKDQFNDEWYRYGLCSLDRYVSDDKGGILVDKVIRLEDIDHDLIPTLIELKLPNVEALTIEQINRRKHKKYVAYYDADTISVVERMFQYDIAEFGYKFGE